VKEVVPAIQNHLITKRRLSIEDAEDILSHAYHGFLRRVREKGPEGFIPKPYIWRAAMNRAIDHGKKTRNADLLESQIAPERSGKKWAPHEYLDKQFYNGAVNHLLPDWQMHAAYLVGGLVEDKEIEPSEAVALVGATILRLTPASAEIINHILAHGAGQTAIQAAHVLRITPNNFGVRKCRAYKEFRELAPQVAAEIGITWRGLSEESISSEVVDTPEFMPSEDEIDGDEK
jgi:DNA-directed RNA polymerase specialized sigma24 family protein